MPRGKPQPSDQYSLRINRVIDYLRDHLDRRVPLRELARVACFSEFHFHRVFSAVTGETVKECTTRLRLEKAARLLRYSAESVTSIALECGFSSSATFSRSFRAGYATSPRDFRQSGEIKKRKIRKALLSKTAYGLPMSEEEKKAAFPVKLVDLPERRIAYIRVKNAFDLAGILAVFRRMAAWARAQGILAQGTLFGMTADDPHVTPMHLCRYEVCFASTQPFTCGPGMSKLTLPAQRYAVVRVAGDLDRVATAWDYLYRSWLIRSRYEPHHAAALEILLEREAPADWSHFKADLCLPVGRLTARPR